jgi:hypothetical protein
MDVGRVRNPRGRGMRAVLPSCRYEEEERVVLWRVLMDGGGRKRSVR